MSTTRDEYDVLVVGSGPAGYVAAIRSAQLGFKTACIDHWQNGRRQFQAGGTYINGGCIACIALLESAKLYRLLQHELTEHGLHVADIRIDLPQMMARKQGSIARLSHHISSLFQHYRITAVHGRARLLGPGQLEVTPVDGAKQTLHAPHIILAAGSTPITLACAPLDHETIIDCQAALDLTTVPERLGIIGAGIIGVEIAGIWRKLGAREVTLLDAQNVFFNHVDREIAEEALRLFTAQGLDIRLGARVLSARRDGQHVVVDYQTADGKASLLLDKLVVAPGRKPNSHQLAAPEAGLLLDENGFVHVDENCLTTVPGVYAIGDLIQSGPMLAHKGLEEGIFVVEQIAGCATSPINYHTIPSVIYSDPEISWVGQTEQMLRAANEPYKTSVFPLGATTRAQASGHVEGFVKLIAHAETDHLLGVHIIGPHASELIAEAVLAMEFSASAEDLARTIHAHPSFSEALHEAALALNGRMLHWRPVGGN